jgi:hypothetical protein
MVIKLEKFKSLTDSMTRPSPGCLAMDRSRIEWIDCRQRFCGLLNRNTNGFFFSHRNNDAEQIIRFIWKTEDIIQIQRSSFGTTNRPYATWIDLDFWADAYLKRSLLLILIRAGLNYDPSKNNYEEALYSEEYLIKTKLAVMRFLFGFTNSLNNSNGWYSTFNEMKSTEIKKNLVLPDYRSPEFSMICGSSALWA